MRWLLFLAGSLFIFERFTRKYSSNDFARLLFYVGKKGSGKTTILTATALKYLKKGVKVYTTEDIPGCYTFDPRDIGKYDFTPGSLILIDEISLVFNNRDWTNFDKDKINFFVLQRHYGNRVIIATQSSSFEKTIRDLVDEVYIVKKLFRIFILARPVNRSVDINNNESGDSAGGQIVFKYRYSGLPHVYILPLYTPFFDSYSIPERKREIRSEYVDMDEMQKELMTIQGALKLHAAKAWKAAKLILQKGKVVLINCIRWIKSKIPFLP